MYTRRQIYGVKVNPLNKWMASNQSRLVVSKLGEALNYQSEEKKKTALDMLICYIWHTLTLIYSFVREVSSPRLLTVHALSLACIIKYVKQKRHSYFRTHMTTQPHCKTHIKISGISFLVTTLVLNLYKFLNVVLRVLEILILILFQNRAWAAPTFPSLHLRHNSFSNPSIALPTSQLILQPFSCFTTS